MGVIGWKMTPGKHIAGMMVGKNTERFIVHFMKSASKAKKVDEIPQAGRAAQGKTVLELQTRRPGDRYHFDLGWFESLGSQAGKMSQMVANEMR